MATAFQVELPGDTPDPQVPRGPDLRLIPPVEQQIGWLNKLVADPVGYTTLWLAQLTAIGSTAYHAFERDGSSRIFVSYPRDAHWAERRARIDALCAHMIENDMRDAVAVFIA
jgi:hypothetical protein